MKGYPVPDGYMGWINGRWRLFATEAEYVEVFRCEMNEKMEE